jgi:prevent-host-death family protein
MRHVPVTEAKATFSGLLAAVEAGETVAIMRHGRVIARLAPDLPCMAAEAFRPFWDAQEEIDVIAPDDPLPDPVAAI